MAWAASLMVVPGLTHSCISLIVSLIDFASDPVISDTFPVMRSMRTLARPGGGKKGKKAAGDDAARRREFFFSFQDMAGTRSPICGHAARSPVVRPERLMEERLQEKRGSGGRLRDEIAGNCYSPYRAG
jgi:hypothetical protein